MQLKGGSRQADHLAALWARPGFWLSALDLHTANSNETWPHWALNLNLFASIAYQSRHKWTVVWLLTDAALLRDHSRRFGQTFEDYPGLIWQLNLMATRRSPSPCWVPLWRHCKAVHHHLDSATPVQLFLQVGQRSCKPGVGGGGGSLVYEEVHRLLHCPPLGSKQIRCSL